MNAMYATHHEILSERYEGGGITLDILVHESQVLPGTFVVRLTHPGYYNNDLHDVLVVFDSPGAPGDGWTHAIGASLTLSPSSRFEIRADHIARAMTIEVRLAVPHGSSFHVFEAQRRPGVAHPRSRTVTPYPAGCGSAAIHPACARPTAYASA